MKVIVKVLCARGSRRSDREIQSDPGTPGMLSCAMVGTRRRLNLTGFTDSRMQSLLPELVDPDILSITSGKMLYRGVAHAGLGEPEAAPKYEQEWSILVLDSAYAPPQ